MKDTIQFGRVTGIPVGAHWSVLLIGGLMTLTLGSSVLPTLVPGHATITYFGAALIGATAFGVSILAHELGHAVTARRNGVDTEGITLWLLGGVARLSREPDSPGSAFRIAVAGPLVSLAVAAVTAALSWAAYTTGATLVLVAVLGWLAVINTMLALFNLIPATPLDGGRILAAALWYRSGDALGAAITAAKAGRAFGTLLVGYGVYQLFTGAGTGLWTMALGFFILSAARAERRQAEYRRRLRHRRRFEPTLMDMFGAMTATPQRPGTPAPVVVNVTSRPVDRGPR